MLVLSCLWAVFVTSAGRGLVDLSARPGVMFRMIDGFVEETTTPNATTTTTQTTTAFTSSSAASSTTSASSPTTSDSADKTCDNVGKIVGVAALGCAAAILPFVLNGLRRPQREEESRTPPKQLPVVKAPPPQQKTSANTEQPKPTIRDPQYQTLAVRSPGMDSRISLPVISSARNSSPDHPVVRSSQTPSAPATCGEDITQEETIPLLKLAENMNNDDSVYVHGNLHILL